MNTQKKLLKRKFEYQISEKESLIPKLKMKKQEKISDRDLALELKKEKRPI